MATRQQQLRSVSPQLARTPTLGRPRTPTRRLIKFSHPPVRAMLPTQSPQQEEKKDLGFIGGIIPSIRSAGSFIWNAGAGLPSLIEQGLKTGASIAQLKTGVGAPDIIRESIQDYETAKGEGAGAIDSISAGLQRRLPLAASYIPSLAGTVGSAAELGSLGRYDYGQSGNEFANALREGRLGAKILEDVGNVLLVGRMLGAGNLAARAGQAATTAGAPRLGTALRRTGYFAEAPIGSTAQGAARLVGRGLQGRAGTGALSRVGTAARAAGAGGLSDPAMASPFRTFGQEFVTGRRAEAGRIRSGLFAERANIEQRIEQRKAVGLEADPADALRLDQLKTDIERQTVRTAERKLATRAYRQDQRQMENVRNFWKQRFTGLDQKGPVPSSVKQLDRSADKARRLAESTTDPVAREANNALADLYEKQAAAKRADEQTGRMTDPQYINDTFAAGVIVESGQVDIVRREIERGILTPDQIFDALLPKETAAYLRESGYTVTPGALQKALDYEQGRADIVDQVSIEAGTYLIRQFSDVMTEARQTGRGTVRGAASPFETGNYPLPEYVLSELAKRNEPFQNTFNYYIGSVIESLLPELRKSIGEDAFRQLGLEDVPVTKLFDFFANTAKDSDTYAFAYNALAQAFDELMTTPDPAKMPEGRPFTPDVIEQIRTFLTDPMIFPAPIRIGGGVERTLQRGAVSRDIATVEPALRQLVDNYGDVLPSNFVGRVNQTLDSLADPGRKFDIDTWRKLQNQINEAIADITKERATTEEQIGVLGERRQQLLGRQQVVENLLRETQIFVENVVRNPEQFFPTETAEVARLRGVASEAQAGLEALGEPGRAERPFRPQTELEDNTRQLEQQKSEIATEVQQVERDISVAERRLAELESLTPEDIRNLESERDIASGIESDIPYEQITTAQAKAELKKRLDDVRERIREEDKALRDATVTFMRTGLTEDLKASIDEGLGAGRPKALYEAFVRRFTKPKPPPGFNVTQLQGRPNPYSDLPWDSAGDAMARNFNLAEADGLSGITEAARRFKRLQDIKAELADLRKVEKSPEFLEDFRKEIEDELNSRVDDYRESQYREVDLTSPDGFTRTADDYNRILNDAQNPDLLRLNLETLRGRARSLQDQLRQIDQTIADNASDVQRRIFENENLRLRGVERRATQEAEGLVSANLQAQTRGVRGMLRGVGAVRQGQPVLQRQFAGPLEADQARMVAEQVANEAKTAALREEFAVEDAALAEAQSIPGQATALSEQLAQPVGPLLYGERQIPYIPAGVGRGVEQSFGVATELVAEAMAPETVGGIEKIRTGTMVPYTPGQYANRVDQILNQYTRNVVVQNFIRNQDFVTTVADKFTPEQLQALRDEATRRNPETFGTDPKIIKDKIDKEYQNLLALEIRKMGLEPISPVQMPDPLDIYADRAPLGDLSETVKAGDINENTLLMTEGIRAGLAAEFAPKASNRVPERIQRALKSAQRKTGSWKGVVLPLSLRWQVGDAMGNVLNAWVRGDIPPSELVRYANMAYDMMRESQTMEGGQLARRGQLMTSGTLQNTVNNPFLALMESYGLQSSGLKQSDLRSMMTNDQPDLFNVRLQGGLLNRTRAGRGYNRFRTGAFAFNEFQNRLAREAVAMQNLDVYLKENGLTFDDVTVERVLADKKLETAVIDAVQKANDVLGNFSELSPFERQTMRTIFPFWSWMKFINKAAMQLLIDQPDRLVFMAHLGGLTMEEDAEGLWEFLKGKPVIGGAYTDLGFTNPYSDAIPFMFTGNQNPLTAAIEETQSISPVLTYPLYALGETAYSFTGRQQPLLPTFSRPGYLEGRPGETTRTLGDTLGGLAYYGLKQFGGPARNVIEFLPDGRIPFTDIATGSPGLPRFPQGSLRTTGQYGVRRLSPNMGRLSAVMRTLGMPAPIVSADVAQRASFEAQRTGRDALQRRLKQRRLAQR